MTSSEDLLTEAMLRNATVETTVELLNMFGEFLSTPSNSPMEDQLNASLEDLVNTLVSGGKGGIVGNVIYCLCAIICETAEHEPVQAYLTSQQEAIQALVEEARRADTD